MADRWARAAKTLDRVDRMRGAALAGLAKHHSSAAFFGCNTVLEAGVFSALLELYRNRTEDNDVDP